MKECKKLYSGRQIKAEKTTALQTLHVHFVLNGVIFRQISLYCPICSTLYNLSGFFLPSITLIDYTYSYRKISLRLARHIPQAKLDNEINVPFLLNEHGDIFFIA